MKKCFLFLLCFLFLAGCATVTPPPETIQPVTEATTEATTEPTTAPTTEATTEPTTETTLPEHSTLYLQDLSVEDVILYFNEVCLDAETRN